VQGAANNIAVIACQAETLYLVLCEIGYEKAHRLLGYQPKHGVESMLDLAIAMSEGKDMALFLQVYRMDRWSEC
jgi:hypothetical protein